MSQIIKKFSTKLPSNYHDLSKQETSKIKEYEISLKVKGFVKILQCIKKPIPYRQFCLCTPIGGIKRNTPKDFRGPEFLIQCDDSVGVSTLKFVLREINKTYKNFDNLIYLENWTGSVIVFLRVNKQSNEYKNVNI